MNLIISTVQQEKQRIDYMLVKYQKALAELPKGKIPRWKKDYFQVHREKRNRKTETTD